MDLIPQDNLPDKDRRWVAYRESDPIMFPPGGYDKLYKCLKDVGFYNNQPGVAKQGRQHVTEPWLMLPLVHAQQIQSALNNVETRMEEEYNAGYEDGRDEGSADAEVERQIGYDNGYQDGLREGTPTR